MKILWKGAVSAQFRANRPKLCGNCAFPQNFQIRKLGQIMAFFTVSITHKCYHHLVFSICLAAQLWKRKPGKVVLKMFQFSLTQLSIAKNMFPTKYLLMALFWCLHCSGVCIVNFEHISYFLLVFLLLSLNKQISSRLVVAMVTILRKNSLTK